MIRFKCPHCKKSLSAKEAQAGRKTACPNCKKPIIVPTPKPKPVPADVEELAAQMLGDGPAKPAAPEPVSAKTIKFNCEFCDGPVEVPFSEAGKKIPCPDPQCRRIIRVPVPKEDKPKDWRDIIKKGPSAAMINQPEQLENAWGTEQKSRVSTGALQDAGAVAEVVVPVGIGVWIKRAFWSPAVVGLIVLAVSGVRRNRTERQEREAIDEALAAITAVGNQPARIKLSAAGLAEIHRAAGELYCGKRKAKQAKDHFRKALAMLQLADKSALQFDVDMVLIELALAQIELGGTEVEIIAKEKLEWPDVQKEVGKSLEAVIAEPARVMAVRLISSRLWEKKQAALAISLAGQASSKTDNPGQPSLLVAQQVALLLARKDKADETQAGKLLPPPKRQKAVIDPIARIAYVEGLVRQENFKDALELARAKSDPVQRMEAQQRMEACVGAAAVILANRSLDKPAAEALPFVKEALLAHQEVLKENKKYQIPPWLLFQLAQAGVCCESAKEEEDCKALAKTLDPGLAQHLKLTCLRLQWAKTNAGIAEPTVDMEADLLPLSLAWEDLARLNARFGMSRDDVMKMTTDERLSPFLLAGFALGKHDRDK